MSCNCTKNTHTLNEISLPSRKQKSGNGFRSVRRIIKKKI